MVDASDSWERWRARVDLDGYDERWRRMADRGQDVHGEADLVSAFDPTSVLDAGCGTGRVAIELAHRGIDVVGVDLDADMIAKARSKAPALSWEHCSLATLDLGRTFDVVVLAGNVIPYVDDDQRAAAIVGCARHLAPDGRLVSGFGLQPGWPTVADYDGWCSAAGLVLDERWSTWERTPFDARSGYAVSVHRPGT